MVFGSFKGSLGILGPWGYWEESFVAVAISEPETHNPLSPIKLKERSERRYKARVSLNPLPYSADGKGRLKQKTLPQEVELDLEANHLRWIQDAGESKARFSEWFDVGASMTTYPILEVPYYYNYSIVYPYSNY